MKGEDNSIEEVDSLNPEGKRQTQSKPDLTPLLTSPLSFLSFLSLPLFSSLFSSPLFSLSLSLCFSFLLLLLPLDLEIPKLSSKQDHPSSSSKPPASPPRRICVVTGGAGHFGKILISELLSKGKYDVIRAYDVVKPNYPDARVESSKGSILDSSGLYRVFEGAETVFHVASLVDLREEAHHQHQLRLVNVLGCQNVVNACVRRAVKKLVYTSSANACIEGKPVVLDERVAEKVLLKNLISTYGRTKL